MMNALDPVSICRLLCRPVLAAATCLLLALASCGGTPQTLSGQNPVAGQPGGPQSLPALSELDDLRPDQFAAHGHSQAPYLPEALRDATRAVSANFVKYSIPIDPLLHAGNGVLDADRFSMLASGNELEWAIYRFDPRAMVSRNLRLEYDSIGSGVWFGRANFASGRWETQQLAAGQDAVEALCEQAGYVSPAGLAYVMIGAYDGSLVEVRKVFVECQQASEIQTEVLDTSTPAEMQLFVLADRPAIVHQDLGSAALLFSQADSSYPAGMQDWQTSTIFSGVNSECQLDAVDFDGAPVVLHTASGHGQLRVAWADSSTPQTAADWQGQTLIDAPLPNVYYSPRLLVSGNSLLAACYEADPLDSDQDLATGYVCIAYPPDGDPSGQWISYRLFEATQAACAIALARIAGYPALAYMNDTYGSLVYAHADNQLPAVQDWTLHELGEVASRDGVYLVELEGGPHLQATSPLPGKSIVAHSASGQPMTAADWTIAESSAISAGNYDVTINEGKLLYAFSGPSAPPYWHVFAYQQFRPEPFNASGLRQGFTAGFSEISLYQAQVAIIKGEQVCAYYEGTSAVGGQLRYTRFVFEDQTGQ